MKPHNGKNHIREPVNLVKPTIFKYLNSHGIEEGPTYIF